MNPGFPAAAALAQTRLRRAIGATIFVSMGRIQASVATASELIPGLAGVWGPMGATVTGASPTGNVSQGEPASNFTSRMGSTGGGAIREVAVSSHIGAAARADRAPKRTIARQKPQTKLRIVRRGRMVKSSGRSLALLHPFLPARSIFFLEALPASSLEALPVGLSLPDAVG